MKILYVETKAGEPVLKGETRLTPISQSIRLQIPGFPGGLIWNRPAAVRIQSPGVPEETLPVRDMTRLIQVLVVGLGLLGGLFTWLTWKIIKKDG